jgi:hypothetical protein
VKLPDTLSLFSELMELKNEYAGLKILMDRKTEQELLYQGEIEWLKEQLLRLQRDKFGPRKEHWQSEEQNILLFNEAEVEAAKPADERFDAEGRPLKVVGQASV